MKSYSNRRDFLKLVGLSTGAILADSYLLAAEDVAKTEKKKRPNLLFIMTDQQPIAGVGAYGASVCRTPNIDSIGRNGIRFSQFHIGAFPCCPSRASIMTGRYAHNHGVTTNEVPLSEDMPSLGTILKTHGYNTGYIGKWHLGGNIHRDLPDSAGSHSKPYSGNWYLERVPSEDNHEYKKVEGGTGEDEPHCGWDHWIGGWKQYKEYIRSVGLGKLADKDPFLGSHLFGACRPKLDTGIHMYSALPEEHHTSAFLADEGVKFLRNQKDSDNPFALVLSFYGPHWPVIPPKPWDEMYGLDEVSLPANFNDPMQNKPKHQFEPSQYKGDKWSADQFRDYVRRYWGYCSYIDYQIGKTVSALKEIAQYDNTIILFTSDHGDFVASHKSIHKNVGNGYDELIRVPFLIQYPKHIKANTTTDALANNIDILPTLLEMMDIDTPKGVDGKSFISLLNGKEREYRDIVFASYSHHNFVATTKKWKFNLNYGLAEEINELYDRINDPAEIHNLIDSPQHKDVVKEMANRIFQWLEQTLFPYLETAKKGLGGPRSS